MTGSRKWLFAASGALVLLASIDSPVLLPYPALVLAVLRGWRLPISGGLGKRLLVSTVLCALLLESGAWLDNFLRNSPEPALFHPQLIADLIIAIGIYAAWWLVWWRLLLHFRFSIWQVFLATGLYGVLIEQQGKIFLAGLRMLPLGLALWLFVFVAYGSTMALAVFLVRDAFAGQRAAWWKTPLAWALLFIATFATAAAWGLLLEIADILPPKRLPMREHPFW